MLQAEASKLTDAHIHTTLWETSVLLVANLTSQST